MVARWKLVAELVSASALAVPASVDAQTRQPADQINGSNSPMSAKDAQAQALARAQARIEQLETEVEALKGQVAQIKLSMVSEAPPVKADTRSTSKESGFSFKPKGLIQWDAGYNGYPGGRQLRGTVSGINFQDLGWNSRARRLVLGAEGSLPGGFRYSAEFNFAQASVDYEDIVIAHELGRSPAIIQLGNFYPFSSLETMTGSKFTSFLERAGITDAFNYNRRLGLGVIANDPRRDSWTFQAGVFNEPVNNGSFTRTGWQASMRGVFSPTFGSARLHFGANFQHRMNTRESLAQTYQARPLNQLTNQRFVSTGNLASRGDDVAGIELGAVFKRFHFASEAQKLWVRHAYNADEIASQNADSDSNDTIPSGAVALNGNPSFWGGYAEVGYYLTGETRGYKNGAWTRTKVLHPFDQGGWGALQLNARVDYLNLKARVDDSSPSLGAPYYVNGGKQVGFEASAIWNPTDYIRLMAQYAHIEVTGGPSATAAMPGPPPVPGIFPEGTTTPINERKYGVDTFAARAQLDF